MNGRELIEGIRGVSPSDKAECCGCGNVFEIAELEPEEAGDWACRLCIRRWDAKDCASAGAEVRDDE